MRRLAYSAGVRRISIAKRRSHAATRPLQVDVVIRLPIGMVMAMVGRNLRMGDVSCRGGLLCHRVQQMKGKQGYAGKE